MRSFCLVAFLLLSGLLISCDSSSENSGLRDPGRTEIFETVPGRLRMPPVSLPVDRPEPNPARNAYFGDLHVHSKWSMDAFVFGTTASPRDAYRYARGEPLRHPSGFSMQLREPLDFYAVTDHGLFLGIVATASDRTHPFSRHPEAEKFHDLNAEENRTLFSLLSRVSLFATGIRSLFTGLDQGTIPKSEAREIQQNAWQDLVEAADDFYDPGAFTTFAAYEYSPGGGSEGSLHRNVIFRDTEVLPIEPFSRFHSSTPERLWDWMDGLRGEGIEALAIPHNSNNSNGQMFALVDSAGQPLDAESIDRRIRNEPLVEITQIKGTSETHPALSDTDEWASFEIKPYVASTRIVGEPKGSYVRDALREGLALADAGLGNPYALGFVAASDTHTGATSVEEEEFYSKLGLLDATPELRGSTPLPWWQGWPASLVASEQIDEVDGNFYLRGGGVSMFGASGLAGVWAEENTRDSLYSAFRRKETFATSGPRIRVRLFAGYGIGDNDLEDPARCATGCPDTVAMGGEVRSRAGQSPQFLAWASRDALSAPLQRLQIIKGWAKDGATHERVIDVACAVGEPNPLTSRCPSMRAPVDLRDCSFSESPGAGELKALWEDPEFDPDQRAFYYVRVLENSTCRWSTWDALRKGVRVRPDLPVTIQERAWSSPIWFSPLGGSGGSDGDGGLRRDAAGESPIADS